jgi:hypothetical protein
VQFEWDAPKAERNRRTHGVTFGEAVSVFADPRELSIFDPDHSLDEDRYVSIGESSAGRLLVVGYTERESAACPHVKVGLSRPASLIRRHHEVSPAPEHGEWIALVPTILGGGVVEVTGDRDSAYG